MADSLEKCVSDWLKKQGFPLEMEVASIARAAGFDVSQSDYYLDPDSGESREIDLVLSVQKYENDFSLNYNLFVECKSSQKGRPWLMFSTPNELGDTLTKENALDLIKLQHAFISNDFGDRLLLQYTFDGDIPNLYPRLNSERQLGYGITQAFAEGGDAPFKAMMSSTKAALSTIKRFGTYSGLTVPFIFSTPVIVIDVPLFAVSFSSETNDLQITEIRKGTLLWKHEVAGRSQIGVYIVTKPELPAFLADCYASAQWWINANENILEKIRTEKLGPRPPG